MTLTEKLAKLRDEDWFYDNITEQQIDALIDVVEAAADIPTLDLNGYVIHQELQAARRRLEELL